VSAALPLIERAQRITAVAIVEPAGPAQTNEALTVLNRFLAHHRLEAETMSVASRGNIGEALIGEIQATEADMIIMGGYGHSRFREWVLGGATRLLLGESPIPVFTTH
jgi:nucleotide-binding universal stress UspA family protein